MYRLEAVTDVRQGPGHDGRHRIRNISLAQCLRELGIFDMTSQIRAHETPLFLHPIRHWRPLLSSVLLTMVVACSPYRPIQRAENDFALAGFKAHPADTTARWQMMNLLPANTLTYRMKENQAVMLYADPTACGCVYMGSPAACRAYMGSHKINLQDARHMTA